MIDLAALRTAADRSDSDTAVVSRRFLDQVHRELSVARALQAGQARMVEAIAAIGVREVRVPDGYQGREGPAEPAETRGS